MKYAWIGFAATTISALSLLPNVYTATIKQNTHSINYLYTTLGFLAQVFWIVYALINKDYPVILLASYLMMVYIVISTSKWHYERTGQDVYSQLEGKLNTVKKC